MIKFKSISKSFKYKNTEIKALDSVSLHIDNNEMVAIMGPSGSGKTTLLNIAGGIFKQTSGEYLFNNKTVLGNESDMAKFRSDNVGFILQHSALINNRNVLYNISLPLKYKNIEKNKIKEKVLIVTDSLGISNKLEMYPHMLSGGECQRVAIARAVISNPNIILADEPTCSLDDDNKYEVLDILKKLNKEGITIIIATHDDTVAQICDRKINIKNGKNFN
ncbi:ABC transporter ATP-binding protein [Sedimentibacter sp. zth1]|uniref:ABC transporter ATP-binding protein n=1 Tax=Sedimentibacter sp. zth1 TaxID=2816908 RepID=UPI001A936136|nr:ABC transporter ATP-binding protein [Sedimentibacter sp. zth1]QSX06267.1 ABC transporter ATP-binding protein [Sedimentibacter sp. zth1]